MALLSPYQRARLLLATAAVLCFCLFWWIGRFFDIPAHPGHEISLLLQPHASVAIVITAIAFDKLRLMDERPSRIVTGEDDGNRLAKLREMAAASRKSRSEH